MLSLEVWGEITGHYVHLEMTYSLWGVVTKIYSGLFHIKACFVSALKYCETPDTSMSRKCVRH